LKISSNLGFRVNMIKTTFGKSLVFSFIICLLIYVFSAFRAWQGVFNMEGGSSPDPVTLMTFGRGMFIYYLLFYGKQDPLGGENSVYIVFSLIFIFDWLLVAGILYLCFFIWEKSKVK
jgi:hypothetical protein